MEELIHYRYAELGTEGDGRYVVYFYAYNPAAGKLQKKRIYINRTRSIENRKRYAKRLIAIINTKLDQGWNPFIDEKRSKMYTKLFSVLDIMLNYKFAYVRDRSKGNYNGRIKKIKQWLKENGKENIFVFEFDDNYAIAFMDELLMKEKIKGRTFNNYLIDYRSFFNLMMKHKYITENPFHSVGRMPEESKTKQPFTYEQSELYTKYLIDNDYDFYITSQYTYYCAIRPNELVQLKVKDVDLTKQLIIVPSKISKNHKQRMIKIARVFYDELKDYLEKYPSNYYLCSKGFRPGLIKIAPTRISGHFRYIANKIGIPNDVYFYSLKDTCAERLIQSGFSVKDIRDLFGHSSIAITDAYLKRKNSIINEDMIQNFPEL